jgi:hypothetical protein
MGDIVDLHGKTISPEGEISPELVVDLARFAENLLTREDVKRRHRFSDEMWEALGSDERFIAAVREESLRRMRDGSTKREKAQQLVTKAPSILDNIMSDVNVSPRHRVDAIKTLDTFAANGPTDRPAPERFIIQINLGEDTIRFNKSIAVDVNDVDPNDIDRNVIAATTTKKNEDDGNGEGHI